MDLDFSLSSISITLVVLLTLRFLALVVYRTTVHPLAEFPGPWIAGATYLYEYYYDLWYGEGLGGRYFIAVDKMHKKYGPIVRITPDEIHIKDSSYFSTVYAGAPARRDKHPLIARMAGDLHSIFGTQNHELHRARKAAVAPLFSKRSINDMQNVLWEQAALLFSNVESQTSAFNLHEILLAFTTDIASIFAHGKSLDFQRNPVATKAWKKTLYSVTEMTPLVRKVPWTITLALKMPQSVIQVISAEISAITSFYSKATADAKLYLQQGKSTEDVKNIYEALRASSLPESDKYIRRYADEALSFLLAGSETTATAITYTVYHVLSNPDILAKVRAELFEVYPRPTDEPKLALLQDLPYLNAVLRETMRHTAMFFSRSTVQAYEELEYGKWRIPPMTPVSMNQRDVLYDVAIYPEPSMFKPERWLTADGKRNSQLDKYWVPFSRGHRGCIALELAMAELLIIISSLLRRYDFELYETDYARDVELVRDCWVGMTGVRGQGIRVVRKGLID